MKPNSHTQAGELSSFVSRQKGEDRDVGYLSDFDLLLCIRSKPNFKSTCHLLHLQKALTCELCHDQCVITLRLRKTGDSNVRVPLVQLLAEKYESQQWVLQNQATFEVLTQSSRP